MSMVGWHRAGNRRDSCMLCPWAMVELLDGGLFDFLSDCNLPRLEKGQHQLTYTNAELLAIMRRVEGSLASLLELS